MENQNNQWFKGSRDRGLRGRLIRDYQVRNLEKYRNEEEVPELLRLKNIQDYWDKDNNDESIAA